MDKTVYRVVVFPKAAGPMEEWLNDFAEKGWSFVTVTRTDHPDVPGGYDLLGILTKWEKQG